MEIATVRIVAPVTEDNPLGFIVINADDRTEDQELFVEPATEDADAAAAAAAAAEAEAKAKADAEADARAKAEAEAAAAAAKAKK